MSDTNALRQRVADELNRRLTDIVISPSLSVGYAINREINSAIKHYESARFRWNEVREATLGTTVQGTKVYSLPADFLRMDTLKVVYSGGYIPIRSRAWEEIDEMDRQVSGSQGIPSKYAIYGNVVRVFPTPNGAYTLIGSYLKRYAPTSVTGSYTAVIPMAGSYSFTITTTASHNNRLNGWTTDGEELVRARAKAGVLINYIKNPSAIEEMRQLQLQREPYLSIQERLAHERLSDETNDALSTGRISPYCI